MSRDQQPWLANPEWAQKRISGAPASNLKTSATAWLAGALALGFGGAELALKGADTWNQGNPLFPLLVVFPAFGVIILYLQVRIAYRRRRYAGTYFEMDSLPFLLGRNLSGRIHVPSPANPRGAVQLTLNCIRRTKSWQRGITGRSKVAWDDLIWRQERSFSMPTPLVAVSANARSVVIPVEFTLPADAPATDSANPDNQIIWSLRISAKPLGPDFVQYFELPVFADSGVSNSPQYQHSNFYAPVAVSLDSTQPPPNGQVVITASSAGGTEFLFRANRHWGLARFATGTFCAWTLAIRFLLWGSDPLAFWLFVAADSLLLFWATWCWLSKSSAAFEHGAVVVRHSLLGFGKSRSVLYRDIQDITAPISRQTGQGAEAIPCYTVFLKTPQGDVEIGGSLHDAGEAGYVVKRMKAELSRSSSE